MPAVRLVVDAGSAAYGTVEAVGLDPALLARLRQLFLSAEDWKAVFPVYTGSEIPSAGEKPPVAGSWAIEGDVLRFRPRYPFVAGLAYTARLDLARLRRLATGLAGSEAAIETSFSLPREDAEPSTVVTAVYPTASELPANLLRLYLHFSAPMSRGEAYEHIRLVDADGRALEHVFLEIGEELWNGGQRRLTLFFDPGRIKRGLRPHLEAGPPLTAGRSYRLVIDPAWRDGDGLPLAEGFEKAFTAAVADRESPDPATWKISPPAAGSREPLELRFPEPLDHGLLRRMIRVTAADGSRLEGRVEIGGEERRFRFFPRQAWRPGSYAVEVDVRLEDPAGNNLSRSFDVDVTAQPAAGVGQGTIALPFSVAASR